jgi:hypothetical protein
MRCLIFLMVLFFSFNGQLTASGMQCTPQVSHEFLLDDQVFFAPREIFDKVGSKRSVPNEESIVSNYG